MATLYRMYFQRSKSTLDSLRRLSMHFGRNRRWVPLTFFWWSHFGQREATTRNDQPPSLKSQMIVLIEQPVPGSQIVGKTRKKKAHEKLAGREKVQKERGPSPLSPVSSRLIFVFALSKFSGPDYLGASLRAGSPVWASEASLARLTSLTQIGELARGLSRSPAMIEGRWDTQRLLGYASAQPRPQGAFPQLSAQ